MGEKDPGLGTLLLLPVLQVSRDAFPLKINLEMNQTPVQSHQQEADAVPTEVRAPAMIPLSFSSRPQYG